MKKLIQFFRPYPVITYKKRETIIRVEDTPQGIYFITHGYVRMYILTGLGSEFTLHIFQSGSLFPLPFVLANIPNTYFFEAMSDTKLARAPVRDFSRFLEENSDIVFEINKRILTNLNSFMVRTQYLVLGNSSHRVVNVLLLLGKKFGIKLKNGALRIVFPVTQIDIARLAGLTRESVGSELSKLEKSGFIQRQKRICTLLKPGALEKEARIFVDGAAMKYSL